MAAFIFDLQPAHAVLNDANRDVVNFFRSVRDSPHQLIKAISSLVKRNSESNFNRRRFLLNNAEWPSSVSRASAFLYLIRNSYAGFTRYNCHGKLNISFNKKSTQQHQLHAQRILDDSRYLNRTNIKLMNTDFANVISRYLPRKNDFVFIGPSYSEAKAYYMDVTLLLWPTLGCT